jgi:hypothetical protein
LGGRGPQSSAQGSCCRGGRHGVAGKDLIVGFWL